MTYSTVMTLNSEGQAAHITRSIIGELHHIIVRTDYAGELNIVIYPQDMREFRLLKTSKFHSFAVYSPRVVATSETGEEITAPPEWSCVYLDDKLVIEISNGQPDTKVEVTVVYG